MRRRLVVLFTAVGLGCASVASPPPSAQDRPAEPPGVPAVASRPIPYPVELPPEFAAAVQRGTRTLTGEPGPGYWQPWSEYSIEARVDTEARTLSGSETIRYRYESPVSLPVLVLNLTQNFHAEGAIRIEEAEVTGGVEIERVAVDGRALDPTPAADRPGWLVESTILYVIPPTPVASGSTVELSIDWSFALPRAGASGRMGYSGEELLYLAYWYPQMAVLDDVIGWHVEPFRGGAEFYSGFASYDITVDAPAGWVVMSTGTLQNPGEVLRPEVVERLRRAERSDEVVRVVAHEGSSSPTAPGEGGRLRWRFRADSVRDAAFAVMRDYAWDAVRTPVGDRDGDGRTDYARVDAFWRAHAVHYDDAAEYARHSLDFLSRFTDLPYPWPHMSVVEGGGIIGGGMEFPMMTLIGDYNERGDSALYYVVAHELAHMWIPMTLSTNERRFAWFDEGTTTFAENNARAEYFPEADPYAGDQQSYLEIARSAQEGPIMRWSDFHYPGPAYGVASYAKPGSVLHALRGVLGEETFMRAYRELHDRWAFRHPYPWDMFHTFERVSGRDLDWFWRGWYYESTSDGPWVLDQAVAEVERLPGGETRITVQDRGWVSMPVHLTITRAGGDVVRDTIPVDRWLGGADRATITVPAGEPVTRVEIDAERHFPDVDRGNNVWTGGADAGARRSGSSPG